MPFISHVGLSRNALRRPERGNCGTCQASAYYGRRSAIPPPFSARHVLLRERPRSVPSRRLPSSIKTTSLTGKEAISLNASARARLSFWGGMYVTPMPFIKTRTMTQASSPRRTRKDIGCLIILAAITLSGRKSGKIQRGRRERAIMKTVIGKANQHRRNTLWAVRRRLPGERGAAGRRRREPNRAAMGPVQGMNPRRRVAR